MERDCRAGARFYPSASAVATRFEGEEGEGGEWAREEEDLGGDVGGWADEMEAMYEDAYYDFEVWDAGEYSG